MKARIAHSGPFAGAREAAAASRAIKSGMHAAGPENRAFAEELAGRFHRRYAVLTSSGASALHLSLLVLGASPRRRVFIPSYVCTAVLNAVSCTGAKARIVDSPMHGFLADPALPFLGRGKDAIVVYPQLFGAVAKIGADPSVPVIEDCAMAMGKRALRQGRISIASFYATKMMSTGQGGAVLTDDLSLYKELLDRSSYDNRPDLRERFNFQMSDIAAAVGRVQLSRLAGFLERRRELCAYYDREIGGLKPEILAFSEGLSGRFPEDVLFRYWVRVANVEDCVRALARKGIEAKRPVFRPLHCYLGLDDSRFPFAAAAWENFLSIPFYPRLKKTEAAKVVEALLSAARPVREAPVQATPNSLR